MADEGFLQRWSRRKAEARIAPETPEPAQDTAPEREAVPQPGEPQEPTRSTGVPGADDADGAIDLDALPDIDALTYESDFTPFMRKGVPPELRKRALQRLWRSNPTLANLDGLVEYGGDYTKIGTAKQVVRTAYQVGRGMLERLEPKAPGEPPPAGSPLTAGQPETTAEPPAPGPDRIAPSAADEAVRAPATRPADVPGSEDEQHAGQPHAARKTRPLPRRG